MGKRKYTSISLPPSTIHELDLWQQAYKESGMKLTKEQLLEEMMYKCRKFLWRSEGGKEIVTYYKALKLVERDKIDLFDAYEKVKAYDEDTTSESQWPRHGYYVMDKDISGIKRGW